MIEAQIICDSIAKDAPRLTTFRLRYPKFIHGEFMTHRVFSRNASSSRAVKAERNLEEVRSNDRAAPVWWGKERKGMASGEELSDAPLGKFTDDTYYSALSEAKFFWKTAANSAVDSAEDLIHVGAHKSIVNRVLEPFLHINVIATSCEEGLLNFFGLRLSRDAQPEMRVLAEQMWAAWQESKPRRLENDQWHLPFIDLEDIQSYYDNCAGGFGGTIIDVAKMVSVGRCAHVSYGADLLSIEKAISLHDRLLENRHFSPFEHQATPDVRHPLIDDGDLWPKYYTHQNQWGNFNGWRQYRKMLPSESLTPLPEGYEYVRP